MIASEHTEIEGIGQTMVMAPSYVVVKVYDSANPDIAVPSAEVTARVGSAGYTAVSDSKGEATIPVEAPKGTSFEVTARSPFYESVSPVTVASQGHRYWEGSNVVPAQRIDSGPTRTDSYLPPPRPPTMYAPAPGVKVTPYVLPPRGAAPQPVMVAVQKKTGNLTTYVVIGGAAVLILGIGILLMTRK
jgi:hypothetical protein